MITDQVERLTEEVAASPDARRYLDSLPVQTREAQPIKDLLAQDSLPDRESPIIRIVLGGLTWGVVVAIMGVVGLLTWAMFSGA